MDPDSIPRSIFIILALVLAGGFFAGSETAYSSCSHIRLKAWAEDGKKSASRALRILDKFDKAIITLLIGNNVVHVIATALATLLTIRLVTGSKLAFFANVIGEAGAPVLSTVVMTLLVFIFSETLPKNIAKANADRFACGVSGILWLLMLLLTPFDLLFMGLSKGLKLLFRSKDKGPSMTEDDFQSMVETIEDQGGLESEESELIQSAVEFTDRTVREVITPRVHMAGINLTDEQSCSFERIITEKFSRLPVYEGDLDHIVGILNLKQYLQQCLVRGKEQVDIRSLMAEPYYITDTMTMNALVDEMRSRKMHLAIVKDEWGGTLGMVTLDDLLEELVGEIWDEQEETV